MKTLGLAIFSHDVLTAFNLTAIDKNYAAIGASERASKMVLAIPVHSTPHPITSAKIKETMNPWMRNGGRVHFSPNLCGLLSWLVVSLRSP